MGKVERKKKQSQRDGPALAPWVVEALAAAQPAAQPAGVLVPFPSSEGTSRSNSAPVLGDARQHIPRLMSTLDQPASSLVMPPCAVEQLAQAVPSRYSLSDWRLLYSTHLHGISINTLYLRCSGSGACILALRDQTGAVFGGFASELKLPSETGPDKRHFYGSGESFLWQLEPIKGLPPLPSAQSGDEPPDHLVHCHRWSGENNYFLLSSKDYLAMGSGGHFGLWIDSELLHGSSGPSATFNNPPLCEKVPPPPDYHITGRGGTDHSAATDKRGTTTPSEELRVGEFVCDVLEVWGVDGHAIKRRNAELTRQGVSP